jgi:hypothetical protein
MVNNMSITKHYEKLVNIQRLIHSGERYAKGIITDNETLIYKKDVDADDALAFLYGYSKENDGYMTADTLFSILSLPNNGLEIRDDILKTLIKNDVEREEISSAGKEKQSLNSIW